MAERCLPDNPKYENLKIQNMEQSQTLNCDVQPTVPEADDGDADDDSFDQDDGFDENSTSMDNFSEADNIDFDDDLGINMENKNTQRKTDTDIRILITYLRSINEMKPPENIPPLELDRYLSTFFSIVKKHDGNEYEPASLRGMLCSVERYLKMKNYPASVTRDLIFANTRHALKLKQQKLRELGKGSKKPIEPFGKVTLEKVDQLFSAHEMGPYTPMSVINTLCFVFIVHFRLRKAIDHKNLLWGDVRLKTNEQGKEYLSYEPLMMNSQDGSKSDNSATNREKVPKLCVFAKPDSPEKDPVGIYKLYSEKRPSTMHYDSSPFYLGITTLHPTAMQAWYRTCAMGVNKLSDLVRMIRDITGLPRATLNAPAESLLAESYATDSFIRNDIPYQLSSSSRTYTPILPKTSDIATRLTKHTLQKQTVAENSEENGTEHDNSRLTTPPRSVQTNTNHGTQIEVLSDSSPRPDSLCSTTEECSSGESVYLNLESAKAQINDMLQKMDLTAIVEFDRWLKKIKISRDPRTGNVVCRESTKAMQDNNDDQNELFPELSTANITLNISLTPMSVIGKDPITVTAHTNMSSLRDNDDLETLDRSDHQRNRGKSDNLIISQNDFKKRIQENLSGKDIEESDLSHSKAKRPRSSSTCSLPVNLSNKPSNDITITSSDTVVTGNDTMSTVAAIIATAKSADAFVRNCSTAINNPQLQPTRLTSSVLTPSLVSGLSSAPQAHTPFLQRLSDREGGLIVPVPIAYPGQKYYTRDNLMLPNQAIFASLSHQPGTAHATYFPQTYQASMTTAATATPQKGPIVSVAPCVKTEPS